MKARRIARIVAAEAAYRAKRRNLRLGVAQAGEVSAVRANVFQGMLFTLFSSITVFALAFAEDVETALLMFFGSVAMTAFFNIMYVTSFTAIFFSEELYKPLQLLPIEPRSLEKILVTAYMLYWGGLSVSALWIPAVIAAPLIAPRYTAYALLAGGAALAVYIASTQAGLILGSYSRLAKSNLLLSMASAAGWVLLMLAFAFLPQIPVYLRGAGIGLSPLYALIPFVGFIMAPLYPLPAAASLAATLAILYVLGVKARRVYLGEPGPRLPQRRTAGFRPRRPLGRVAGLVRKDYLLLLREPRRLAGVAYLYLFPFIFILGGALSDMWSVIAGVSMGVSSTLWIYLEGEAARHLYELPLTFLDVYLSKLADSLIPLALVATALLPLHASPLAVLLLALGHLSEASAMIALTLAEIPEEPSAWSEAVSTKARHVAWLIATMALFIAVPLAASMAGRWYGAAASAILAAASLAAGAYSSCRRGAL